MIEYILAGLLPFCYVFFYICHWLVIQYHIRRYALEKYVDTDENAILDFFGVIISVILTIVYWYFVVSRHKFSIWLVCIFVLGFIVYSLFGNVIMKAFSKRLNMSHYLKLKEYRDKLSEIKKQKRHVFEMQAKIKTDVAIPFEEVDKNLKILDETDDALNKAYTNLLMAYNAARVSGTFDSVVNLMVSDDAKKDLQKQLDVLHSLEELG